MVSDLEPSSIAERLATVDERRAERDRLGPLSAEQRDRIWRKFRLDWNYHSNAIEGNSLSYGETTAFLMHGLTAKGKPFKDYLDIRGHNQVIEFLLDYVKRGAVLTEAHIREMHKIVLVEPYDIDAHTPDGGVTQKRVVPGEYKTLPNHVRTRTGEMRYFAAPEEVAMRMGDLMAWYRQAQEDATLHPIVMAARFHHEFVSIHPFDDGNGRMARILMNLILLQRDYLPAVIRTEQRDEYYLALAMADSGDLEPLVELVAGCAQHAFDIWLRGARGESIEEPRDLDKGLALLTRKMATHPDSVQVALSQEIVDKLLKGSLRLFFDHLAQVLGKFDTFFLYPGEPWGRPHALANLMKLDYADALNRIRLRTFTVQRHEFTIAYRFREFRSERDPFSLFVRVHLHFEENRYGINFAISHPHQGVSNIRHRWRQTNILSRRYDEQLTVEEAQAYADQIGSKFLAYINARHDDPSYGTLTLTQDRLDELWQSIYQTEKVNAPIPHRRSIILPIVSRSLTRQELSMIQTAADQLLEQVWQRVADDMHFLSLELQFPSVGQ